MAGCNITIASNAMLYVKKSVTRTHLETMTNIPIDSMKHQPKY